MKGKREQDVSFGYKISVSPYLGGISNSCLLDHTRTWPSQESGNVSLGEKAQITVTDHGHLVPGRDNTATLLSSCGHPGPKSSQVLTPQFSCPKQISSSKKSFKSYFNLSISLWSPYPLVTGTFTLHNNLKETWFLY